MTCDEIEKLCADATQQMDDSIKACDANGELDNLTAVAGRKLVPQLVSALRELRERLEYMEACAIERSERD